MEHDKKKQRLLPEQSGLAQNDSPSAPRLGSITGRSSWKLQAKRPPSGNVAEVLKRVFSAVFTLLTQHFCAYALS